MKIRKNPHIYEINLKTWLAELSLLHKREIRLKNIPREEWHRLKSLGMDLVWLMGIWERGTNSMERARNESYLVKECEDLFPDFCMNDFTGSPYAIHEYVPDPCFGTKEDLISLKEILLEEGLLLILDFVPNHTACDHPWISMYPERYIMKSMNDGGSCDAGFFQVGDGSDAKCIAHGKDPYFPPWTDTAQLNYAEQHTIEAMTETLLSLSSYCHGLRCDMAMLLLRDVFINTWGTHLKEMTGTKEFWPYAIQKLRAFNAPFLLMAEVYWGKEEILLGHGFDYVYDKHLYDMMIQGNIEKIRDCISSPVSQQENLVRFLENHDEPRAATAFGPHRIHCAMVIQATLPGMRFWHHGQLQGKKNRIPVQLGRAPMEKIDKGLQSFGERLLREVDHSVFHEGSFKQCDTHGWPDNNSNINLLAYCWGEKPEKRLIIVNFSSSPSQGYVKLPPDWTFTGEKIILNDPLKGDSFERSIADVTSEGLYVGLNNGDYHFFKIQEV